MIKMMIRKYFPLREVVRKFYFQGREEWLELQEVFCW